MASAKIIQVIAFGLEIGKLGYDMDQKRAVFQYNPDFLSSGKYLNLFPFIFRRVEQAQVFTEYHSDTFQGLPPMIADSLPDTFGAIIFQEWLSRRGIKKLTPLEQLAYVADRGMGALEYKPVKELLETSTINIGQVVEILERVLKFKDDAVEKDLSELSLLNIFKIGSSAGGARPKILVAEHKDTGALVAGDRQVGSDYNHYLIKLHLDDSIGYSQEHVEYAYYLMAQEVGIEMMPSKLIEDKHFATLRYDRQKGEKQHAMTVSGLTGWDFQSNPENSSYENVFKLALGLKVPFKDLQQLYRRMIFNLVFRNSDDHLKNHSFIYEKKSDTWSLSPAYDLTYSLNPLINFKITSRALSIRGKRQDIGLKDLLILAEEFSIKNPKKIIDEVQKAASKWNEVASELQINKRVIQRINDDFVRF
jgi:serine/threonine-protein kinase HipA